MGTLTVRANTTTLHHIQCHPPGHLQTKVCGVCLFVGVRDKNKVTKLQEKYKFLISVDSGVYVSYDGLSMHTAPFTCLTGCYIPTNCSLSVNQELAGQAPGFVCLGASTRKVQEW